MDVVTASRALAVLFMGYVVAWPLRHADRVTDLETVRTLASRDGSAMFSAIAPSISLTRPAYPSLRWGI